MATDYVVESANYIRDSKGEYTNATTSALRDSARKPRVVLIGALLYIIFAIEKVSKGS